MAERNNGDTTAGFFSLIGALVVGAAVGAVLGLLFAPKSGKELREDLKRKSAEQAEEFKARAEGLKSKAGDIVEELERVREDIEGQTASNAPPSEGQ